MRHTGPDDQGIFSKFCDQGLSVILAHRRLSIIDLENGHQPMQNEEGSIAIVFNGEIYNYQELRNYLQKKGHTFRSQSDTEVIIHAYEEYGVACLSKFRGMFSFAIFDKKN